MIEIINSRGDILNVSSFLFPAGEVGIKLDPNNYRFFDIRNLTHFNIIARITDSNELISLAMVKDALDRISLKFKANNIPVNLILPYLPYARQDRVCVEGEAFSLKVLGKFIISLNFNKVVIFDPHSAVSEAVIDNCISLPQLEIIHRFNEFKSHVMSSNSIFVSPDAGANKKTSEIAGYFNHSEFIRADKLRDLATGKIKETVVYADDLTNRDIFIVDDICDGGRTFIELAKVLKSKNSRSVNLYVTHGIFSKGTEELLSNGIDTIYTTNSFNKDIKSNSKLTVLNLEGILKFDYLF